MWERGWREGFWKIETCFSGDRSCVLFVLENFKDIFIIFFVRVCVANNINHEVSILCICSLSKDDLQAIFRTKDLSNLLCVCHTLQNKLLKPCFIDLFEGILKWLLYHVHGSFDFCTRDLIDDFDHYVADSAGCLLDPVSLSGFLTII